MTDAIPSRYCSHPKKIFLEHLRGASIQGLPRVGLQGLVREQKLLELRREAPALRESPQAT
jgi:hypothetical protein